MRFAPTVGLYNTFSQDLPTLLWRVEEGVWIWISVEESSVSSTHSLLIIMVNSLMDSLRNSLSIGSQGVTRTGGLFWHEYFEVFPKSSKSSSSKYGRSEGWKPSLGSFGLGEGLSNDAMGSSSTEETCLWFSLGSTQRGSSGGVFSRMRSRRASPSAVVLWVNEPSAAMSRCRVDSLLSPNQKCYRSTWLGKTSLGQISLKLRIYPKLHLWFPSLFVRSWVSPVVGQQFGI